MGGWAPGTSVGAVAMFCAALAASAGFKVFAMPWPTYFVGLMTGATVSQRLRATPPTSLPPVPAIDIAVGIAPPITAPVVASAGLASPACAVPEMEPPTERKPRLPRRGSHVDGAYPAGNFNPVDAPPDSMAFQSGAAALPTTGSARAPCASKPPAPAVPATSAPVFAVL